ncbi:unnamed protein product [Dovyalis caffra]|uniref:FRIGIDA-like protein n=1 Tax=Dovyalis caffra TaxID=77055 RepID=A0AAV1RJR0_9ROSI|nr:unnamed protein product [Dovyalis caffra]
MAKPSMAINFDSNSTPIHIKQEQHHSPTPPQPQPSQQPPIVKTEPPDLLIEIAQPPPQSPPKEPQFLKSINDLTNLSAAIDNFKKRFDELQNHLNFIDNAITARSNELKPKAQQLQPTQTEKSAPSSSVAVAVTETTKITETETAAAAPATEKSEIRSLCEMMCGRGLRKYVVSNLSNVDKLREEVPAALKCAPKPAKLVLDCIGRFYLQGSKAYEKESPMITGREASILVLEFFLLISDSENAMEAAVKKDAEQAAVSWRKRLISEGGVRNSGEIDAKGLLLLIGGFGIPKLFSDEDVFDLVKLSNSRQFADLIRRSRFLVTRVTVTDLLCGEILNMAVAYIDRKSFFKTITERARLRCDSMMNSDIIERMLKKGMKVEAVDVACIFGMEDKFSVQKLLFLIVQESKEPLKGRKREANNSPAIEKEAKEKQLIALKSVVKFLEEHQLDPTEVLPGCQLEEKIIELEKDIANLNKKINKQPLSKRPANVNEVSNYWKSQETKRRRFAEKGSPLISPGVGLPDQIAASYMDGQSSHNNMMRLNGGFPGLVNNSPAGTSSVYGSGLGPFPENFLGATAASGVGLSAAYGGSAGVRREMLVEGTGQVIDDNLPLYAWHRAGVTALNGGSVGYRHPASGLFGQSPSIEGFAGQPNSPPAVAANGSSAPDLYGFADAPSLAAKQSEASDRYGFADAPTVTANQTAASDLYGFADAVVEGAYGSTRHTGPLPLGLGSHYSSYMR